MSRLDWQHLFQTPLDVVGFAVFVLVFPAYHLLYPILLMRLFPRINAKSRFDRLRASWIEGIVERKDYLLAAQQTRNLTMVNTLLASSSLILMGVSANLLIELGRNPTDLPLAGSWGAHPEAEGMKLLLLIVVFGIAFGYCMSSLRHLGHFNIVVGASKEAIEEYESSARDYLSGLINRASNRHTLAVRCLYSATPIFLWLFDTRLFVLVTVFWGAKFMGQQDFTRSSLRRLNLGSAHPSSAGAIVEEKTSQRGR